MKITKEIKNELKDCYENILDEADKIDEILEGSCFVDEIWDLIEKQVDYFKIKLD